MSRHLFARRHGLGCLNVGAEMRLPQPRLTDVGIPGLSGTGPVAEGERCPTTRRVRTPAAIRRKIAMHAVRCAFGGKHDDCIQTSRATNITNGDRCPPIPLGPMPCRESAGGGPPEPPRRPSAVLSRPGERGHGLKEYRGARRGGGGIHTEPAPLRVVRVRGLRGTFRRGPRRRSPRAVFFRVRRAVQMRHRVGSDSRPDGHARGSRTEWSWGDSDERHARRASTYAGQRPPRPGSTRSSG